MNKENFKFYLAGHIWNEPLNITKRDWRQFLTKKIESIGHVAIDPTKKKNEKFESETVSDVISYRKKYGFGSEKTSEFIDWIYFEDLNSNRVHRKKQLMFLFQQLFQLVK